MPFISDQMYTEMHVKTGCSRRSDREESIDVIKISNIFLIIQHVSAIILFVNILIAVSSSAYLKEKC